LENFFECEGDTNAWEMEEQVVVWGRAEQTEPQAAAAAIVHPSLTMRVILRKISKNEIDKISLLHT
jgi:hypothetical protein